MKKPSAKMQMVDEHTQACSLEQVEIEAIGLEIAKLWIARLSESLQTFQDLF